MDERPDELSGDDAVRRLSNGGESRELPDNVTLRQWDPSTEEDAAKRSEPSEQPVPGIGSDSSDALKRSRRRAAAFGKDVTDALESDDDERLSVRHLLQLLSWSTLTKPEDKPKRALSDKLLPSVQTAFEKRGGPGCQLALSTAGVVWLETLGARLQVYWLPQKFAFDVTDARGLVDRIEAVSDAAFRWWPDLPENDRPAQHTARGRLLSGTRQDVTPAAERAVHIDRTFEIATMALSAVASESRRQRSRDSSAEAAVSDAYRRTLAQAHERAARVEDQLDRAGQRAAQARYGSGMVVGMLALLLLLIPLCAVLSLSGFDLTYAIALGAGGVGAVVSVLQRMTSNQLRLDIEGASLRTLGMARPVVGAIFGVLVVALVESGLFTFAPRSGSQAALDGVLAFFAGFNERFAQDALSSSVGAASPPGAPAIR